MEVQERAWQHEKERLEMELHHAEKLAKIEAKKPHLSPQVELQKDERWAQKGLNSPPVRVPKSEWRERALDILRENPHIKGAELGRKLGASERTGQNILSQFEQAGIVHKNGNGWEVAR
jgi:hypothetical protein